MNLILLFDSDFSPAGGSRALLTGRRLRHVLEVHRAKAGEELTVGVVGGRLGRGRVVRIDSETLELDVALDRDPPPKLPLALVLALPRPKVLDRVLLAAASLGIPEIHLVNGWRVEKSFWSSPRIAADHLREPLLLGLEQAKDTVLPRVELHRFFVPFVEERLPGIADGSTRLVGHPIAETECPRSVAGPVTLAIGPEGGWIADEIATFERLGFQPVSLGARILRVESVVTYLVGRLF